MKFVVARDELNRLMNRVSSIISTKPSNPVLGGVLFEVDKDELVLTSTDLTMGIRCFTKAKVLQSGSALMPGRHFSTLLSTLTASNISVAVNEAGQAEVDADSSHFRMYAMNRSSFPTLPEMEGATEFSIPRGMLRDALYRTSFAVSREDNQYVLTGVHLEIRDRCLTFIATDGRRLARTNVCTEIDPSVSGVYVLPIKAVEEMQKWLEGDEEEAIKLFVMGDKLALEASQVTVITKLLKGDYPDVDRVIPKSSESTIALHREELMTLLRQVSLFAPEKEQSVRFCFTDGELQLSATSAKSGEGKVSMPVNYNGPQLDIAFNSGFFLDILKHSHQETVNLALSDRYNPGVITDAEPDKDDPESLFVLMPMRFQDE
jgi:DNA polymerase-3 subunit beta